MKRIISILLVLIMVFSLTTSAYAGRIHFTESDRARYDVDAYYEHVFDNFNNLFEFTPWPFLTQDELFAYRGFVRNMEQNAALRLMLPSGLWVTGESATVERYIEILVNFMMLMQHDLNEIHNHMAEADALKTFWDYAADVGSIVMNSLKVADSVNRFGQLAYSTFNVAKDCISSYRLLSKMLLDFENQYHFLTVIIRYANNDNLVAAARVLRNNAERIMEYRMNFFIENSYRIAEYIGRDVLIDVVVMEIITNPEHLGQLGLSAVDQFALKSLADGYKALNTMLAAVHVARGLGVFAADMLAGISNVFNRVVEIRAMYDINRALITSAENLRRNVRSANDIDTIERVVGNMRYMLWVNARGDYLLYQMAMYDGQLLSLLFTDRQTTRNWYALVQTMFQSLVFPIEHFWPEREWFLLDDDSSDFVANWKEWFQISYDEWTLKGITATSFYGQYNLSDNNDSVLIFADQGGGRHHYPIGISIPIIRLLGRPSTSVGELRDIYGSRFSAEYSEFHSRWMGFVEGDYLKQFWLGSENDTSITSNVLIYSVANLGRGEQTNQTNLTSVTYEQAVLVATAIGRNTLRSWGADINELVVFSDGETTVGFFYFELRHNRGTHSNMMHILRIAKTTGNIYLMDMILGEWVFFDNVNSFLNGLVLNSLELSNFMGNNGFTVLGAELAEIIGIEQNRDSNSYVGGIPVWSFREHDNNSPLFYLRSNANDGRIYTFTWRGANKISLFTLTTNDTWETIQYVLGRHGYSQSIHCALTFSNGMFSISPYFGYQHHGSSVPQGFIIHVMR